MAGSSVVEVSITSGNRIEIASLNLNALTVTETGVFLTNRQILDKLIANSDVNILTDTEKQFLNNLIANPPDDSASFTPAQRQLILNLLTNRELLVSITQADIDKVRATIVYTQAEKDKLDSVAENANAYILTLGAVYGMVKRIVSGGDGVSIVANDSGNDIQVALRGGSSGGGTIPPVSTYQLGMYFAGAIPSTLATYQSTYDVLNPIFPVRKVYESEALNSILVVGETESHVSQIYIATLNADEGASDISAGVLGNIYSLFTRLEIGTGSAMRIIHYLDVSTLESGLTTGQKVGVYLN